MPVRRFESHQDAREALWTTGDDPELAGRIRALWERSARLVPGGVQIPRGVYRYRSIEEAAAAREAWTRERVHAIRAARQRNVSASSTSRAGDQRIE